MKELSLNNCRLDGRYDVRERLGRGSYAEIYLARDILASTQSPHSQVVIKALNVFLQDDLDADLERTLVENFQNEATALDRVRHPNIISRTGHGTARDLDGTVFHYLVLEFLAGGDLQRRVRGREVSFKDALRYVEQVCAGLAHAHSRGVIHRDIKPHNLLLTPDLATVKIADFGVARVNISDSPITRVGTNVYAPPEHSPLTAGKTGQLPFARLTPAADIYSLAKTFYTLASGEPPRTYVNATIAKLPDSIGDAPWSVEMLRVLGRATHDDPRERHQTIGEFWTDLAIVRRLALDGEEPKPADEPQPRVARGYTPIAPEQPRFETFSDRPLPYVPPSAPPTVVDQPPTITATQPDAVPRTHVRRPSRLRRAAVFAVLLIVFSGLLYGTAVYMRGRGALPILGGTPTTRLAVASTDIYLRPAPNADNEPVGLVTKNSKVRIVNSRDNWYQVDIVEQGRVRASSVNATRGWLNGKYLDLARN